MLLTFSVKYACVIPLKDKNVFKKTLGVSSRKPNKMWTDKGSPFRSMKSWSQGNEGKSVVAERFIRTLKSKIQKYMTSISKHVYIDKLDDTVKKYNNTYHSIIKIKSVDVKSSTYIDSK